MRNVRYVHLNTKGVCTSLIGDGPGFTPVAALVALLAAALLLFRKE